MSVLSVYAAAAAAAAAAAVAAATVADPSATLGKRRAGLREGRNADTGQGERK